MEWAEEAPCSGVKKPNRMDENDAISSNWLDRMELRMYMLLMLLTENDLDWQR